MSVEQNSDPQYKRRVPWIAHSLVSVVILIIALVIVKSMFGKKPETKRWGQGKAAPVVAVEVTELQREDYQVWLDSYGTAEALTQTELVAEVNGRVVTVSDNIRAGQTFAKGDVLVTLDDRDFKVEVDVAAASAAEAKLAYLQEVAEAEFAAKRWNQQPDNEAARLLALRQPQLESAKAALRAAESRLERAKLDLARTKIRAPFNGKVLRQSVDLGQVVNPTQSIATIYSTDVVEVRLPIKVSELDRISLPDLNNTVSEQPKVALAGEIGSTTFEWSGKIVRSEGALDPATRMLFVVAQIDDPFVNNEQRPAIRVGQFLRAKIEGKRLEDVFVLPRRAVSQDNRVSIMQGDMLNKLNISPVWTDEQAVVVASQPNVVQDQLLLGSSQPQLKVRDKLITTPTANLPDGTKVKTLGADFNAEEGV